MGDSLTDSVPSEDSVLEVLGVKTEKNGKTKSRKKELRSVEVLLKSMSHLTIESKLKVCHV